MSTFASLYNADDISFDFNNGADYSITSSPCTPPHTISYKALHSGFPADASTWIIPSAPSNVATSSPNALSTAGPWDHGTTFSDPYRCKARAEDSDAPWRESPSVNAFSNGVDAVSAAFLQLIEAHGCGPNPEVVSLLRSLLCNSCLPREELLDVVDWHRLLRLAATSSSRVLHCAAWLVPSTTSSHHSKLGHSPNSLTSNATTILSDLDGVDHSAELLPPADTMPCTAISDYELHGMQPLSLSPFSNGPASPTFSSGAPNIVRTVSTIPTTPSTNSPELSMPPPMILFHPSGPEPPPEKPFNSSEPPMEPELHRSSEHQQPASETDAATGQKRRCLDCAVEHTKQWRTHPKLPGYLCNACGQHQAKHKSPRSILAIRRERARANEKYVETVPTRSSSPPEKRGGEVIMRVPVRQAGHN
ncbi:hypothetical protein B0H19DRAFT_1071615 [Mycena capillaripes]|nr:hypothetical protein B0H19DRAFT_1071615 [Mycena capillaripes]